MPAPTCGSPRSTSPTSKPNFSNRLARRSGPDFGGSGLSESAGVVCSTSRGLAHQFADPLALGEDGLLDAGESLLGVECALAARHEAFEVGTQLHESPAKLIESGCPRIYVFQWAGNAARRAGLSVLSAGWNGPRSLVLSERRDAGNFHAQAATGAPLVVQLQPCADGHRLGGTEEVFLLGLFTACIPAQPQPKPQQCTDLGDDDGSDGDGGCVHQSLFLVQETVLVRPS